LHCLLDHGYRFDGTGIRDRRWAQINYTLKQAAIEEGQWTEERDFNGIVSMDVVKAQLNAGRQRVADAKVARDAAVAKAKS
jgi:hypothetical protein